MDNIQITTLCEGALVVIRLCPRTQRWFGERALDGRHSPLYEDLRALAEDLAEAGHLDHFWGSPELGPTQRVETTPQRKQLKRATAPRPTGLVDVLQWAAE
jgi:hypothetical protein